MEKVFGKEFYESSPLLKGLKRAEEIVVILDEPIGDSVVSVPILHAITRWLKANGKDKPIKLVTKHTGLFASLEEQFPGMVQIVPRKEMGLAFSTPKERFVINTDKIFQEYNLLGLNQDAAEDPSRVLSVDWASWQKEVYPEREGRSIKYDPIPARIARNFEIMTGQRLFADINGTKSYIERSSKFDQESQELRTKYGIAPDAEIFVISAGSGVTPKEYEPQKWRAVLKGIFEKSPNAHVLFWDDPNPKKRDTYGKMVDEFKASTGNKISRIGEGLDKANTIMGMADKVLTPDTGLGHYAGAMGKDALMLYLVDPVLWSTPGARRINHQKAYEMYRLGEGVYRRAWDRDRSGQYYVEDNGVLVGASDIDPQVIIKALETPSREKPSPKPRNPDERMATFTVEKFMDHFDKVTTFEEAIDKIKNLPGKMVTIKEGGKGKKDVTMSKDALLARIKKFQEGGLDRASKASAIPPLAKLLARLKSNEAGKRK